MPVESKRQRENGRERASGLPAESPAASQAVPSRIERLALRPNEAAEALGIGKRKLWELTNRGVIPHVRLDKAILYPVESLNRWLSAQSAMPTPKHAKRT
jgi:excisionase family DNA binding protein